MTQTEIGWKKDRYVNNGEDFKMTFIKDYGKYKNATFTNARGKNQLFVNDMEKPANIPTGRANVDEILSILNKHFSEKV